MLRKSSFFLLFALFLSGCLPHGSVYPTYTPEAVLQMPELDGRWFNVEKGQAGKEKNSRFEIKESKFISLNDDGSRDSANLVFFKVEESLFADLQLDNKQGESQSLPHMLFKIVKEEDKLTFVPLDYGWVKGKADTGEINLPYIKGKEDGDFQFSAKADRWAAFLKTYKDDQVAFSEKEKFVLQRNVDQGSITKSTSP